METLDIVLYIVLAIFILWFLKGGRVQEGFSYLLRSIPFSYTDRPSNHLGNLMWDNQIPKSYLNSEAILDNYMQYNYGVESGVPLKDIKYLPGYKAAYANSECIDKQLRDTGGCMSCSINSCRDPAKQTIAGNYRKSDE
jgi:hypothetical protein